MIGSGGGRVPERVIPLSSIEPRELDLGDHRAEEVTGRPSLPAGQPSPTAVGSEEEVR